MTFDCAHLLTMAFSFAISRAPTASTAVVTTGMPIGMTYAEITQLNVHVCQLED